MNTTQQPVVKQSDFKYQQVYGAGGRKQSVYICPKHGCWLNSSQIVKHIREIEKWER